jgi:soluble lytic murein transglycosylase-like protein
VKPSHGVASPKPRIILKWMAALAMLAACAVPAGASAETSGGISTDDGTRSEKRVAESDAKYQRLWDRVSPRDKRWARSTSKCESGRDPRAIGGGGQYRGAFQFMKSTWRRSPKSPGGDPIEYPYRTQAVVAVALKNRDGAGHWPNCG